MLKEKREAGRVCVVCMDAPNEMIFGCGHLCTCSECAIQVLECPVCRAPIEHRIRVYGAGGE